MDRAEKYLRSLTVAQPGDIMLVLALIGAQGVGGFQLDVGVQMTRLTVASLPVTDPAQAPRVPPHARTVFE